MKLDLMCKDKRLGMSLQEVRNFVEQTATWPGDSTYLDCHIPADGDGVKWAALMGLAADADIKCPRCGKALMGDPVNHSLSRVDNKTRICSGCGNDEAMWDYSRTEPLPPLDRPVMP